ncbi:MAG: restriction endonuclease [Halovenus sp.]
MANVINLIDEGTNHESLQRTGSNGFFGGQYLSDGPLSTYLVEGETPRYLVRNKKSGLRIVEESGTEHVKPDDDRQALALVTDMRLLVAVGKTTGDEIRSLSLVDVVEASAEDSGFLETTLAVETLDGTTWRFPFRGDVSEVATDIDDIAQVRANANRLLDDVERQIELTQRFVANGNHADAAEALSGAGETIGTARQRIREVGGRAAREIDKRAAPLRPELDALRRQIAAGRGGSAHASAQAAWEAREYERAAEAYNTAIEAYERALEQDGERPPREALVSRVSGAVRERELLRVAPRIDADATRRRARATTDPEDAADIWTVALDSYRDMLGLHWPGEDRSFVVDRDLIREQTTAVADDAIEDHSQAGESWLTAGDELAVEGRKAQADQVYERAREQFQRALALAREVRPDWTDELESSLEAVETRLEGHYPSEVPEDEPLSVEELQGARSDEPEDDDRGDGGDRSVLTRIREQKQRDSSPPAGVAEESEDDDASAWRAGLGQSDSAGTSTANGGGDTRQEPAEQRTERSGTVGDGTGTAPGGANRPDSPATDPAGAEDERVRRLRALDEQAFTEFVASVWSSQGYTTTVFSATKKAVYDIVAVRQDPEKRLLLWTAHPPDGGSLGSTAVERCATARDSNQGADGATLVTSGRLTDAARARAAELDVTVVDCDDFADLIESLELDSLLEEGQE